METLPFASLAQLNILIIPIGPIRASVFNHWASLIRSFTSIRLADIPPDPRQDRSRFLPSALSSGSIHLAFPSHPPPSTAQPYALFRPASFVHGVIGVADCSSSSSLAALLAEFYGVLHEVFGPNPVFPLAGRCYAFDPADSQTDLDVGGALEGLTVIPTVVGDKRIYLGTLLANFCGCIIGEFAGLVRVLDNQPRLDELNRFLLPTLSQNLEGEDTPLSPVFAYAYSSVTPNSSSLSSRHNGSSLEINIERSDCPDTLPSLTRSETLPSLFIPVAPTARFPNGRPLSGASGLGIQAPSPVPSAPPGRTPSPLPFIPKRAATASPANFQGFKSRSASIALAAPPKRKQGGGMFSHSARLGKITADLFLLSGRLGDAAQWYSEAVGSLKGSADIIWCAAALEGWVVANVLDAWGKQDQPTPPQPTSGHDPPPDPWVDPLEKLTQAVALYWKASPTAPDDTSLAKFELTAITTLYCDSVVRLTKFLFAIWAAGGWGHGAFNMLMSTGPPLGFSPRGPSPEQMLRQSQTTSITRTQIANVAAQAHGPFLLALLPLDRVRLLSFLASTYSLLGFWRKEAYVLRELNAALMELLISAREEAQSAGPESTMRFTAGLAQTSLGSEFSLALPSGRTQAQDGGIAMRENERVDGNDAIVQLMQHVCEVYGVGTDAVRIRDGMDGGEGSGPDEQRVEQKLGVRGTWEQFGWPELQVGVMRESISLVELLPDYPAVAQLALSAIRKLGRYLPSSEQLHLYAVSMRALGTARRRGDTRRLHYWSDNPLVRIEPVPLPLARLPTVHALSDLQPPRPESDAQVQAGQRKDPFLYNPRLQAASSASVIAVQYEPLELIITLRNPHAFDFDLQSVVLDTRGVPFRTQPASVSIPANAFQVLRMSGVPLEPGTLAIRGCTVQVNGCLPRTFLFPLQTKEDELRLEKRQLALELDYETIKDGGLDARALPFVIENKRRSILLPTEVDESRKYLEWNVLPEQPMMRVKRTSLTHGALMLYEGETAALTLTLENMSNLKVNFIRVTFEDSTMAPAQAALAEGELSTAAQYETEFDLVRRPVFKWERAGDIDIPGGKTSTISLTCLGKPACTSGTVQISYGCLPDEPAERAQFYTRQILYPVLVTVYHNLECQSMDVMRFSPTAYSLKDNLEKQDIRRTLLDVPKDGDWCLFTVDVRNMFGIPFEVTLERTQKDAPEGKATQIVPPGSTLRLMLPLRREYLTPSSTSEPIPSLLQRQFLVSKARLSTLEEREQRLLYWYREQLFSSVRATWREPISGRAGELSLRKQRMKMPMLEAFRAQKVQVEVSVLAEGEGEVREIEQNMGRYEVPSNDWVYLRVKVTNVHWQAAHMALSFSAIPPTPTAFVLHEGSLTDLPLGEVAQGGSTEREVCMVFVAEGRFSWAATVKICDEPEEAGRREISLVAGSCTI
ncbi:hypothetical protein DACRYDRAFT_113706 [Dacryopinax primogenitus]|uniref:Trs120-domain-containing protein n=1 Tax=Dacryopinax primogenitus (strain DJM 731) TaxID=1858805 RepID=M5G9Z9_DACPD|nr:uncharacterized protein DACRYDRAFT_113706 [Dacryopinax primogenitus]EJU05644.1 hypothetical protein DACRYDRAFT_113706 [Dacryopinax primogenitus]